MTTRGILLVIAAPSGAGKSTLVRALLEREPGIRLSTSHTTRAPRAGEVPGTHYHFVSHAEFQRMIEAEAFFEHAQVHGDLKGTSMAAVKPLLAQGRDVLLEIDWQGARQVRARVPECRSIFILPPSREELERRLRSRASDSEAAIARRLEDSRVDIAHATEFDYIVVNDRLEDAIDDLCAIVRALRLRAPLQHARHEALIAALLHDSAPPSTTPDNARESPP
ncbi:MAG TPA: guanylate kinase [Rhodanobacteraceae bacterium]|nr:guanylate kinase [Rhodanobacteraceae bacterium]